jgi:hypothetical protein
MLNDADARAMRDWVIAAKGWSESAQGFVGAATELATISRGVADRIDAGPEGSFADPGRGPPLGPPLEDQLRELADSVEDDTRALRDRYLVTAAAIDEYGDVLR